MTASEGFAQRLFYGWLIALLPWVVISPLLAMAFDSPPTVGVYIGVWSVWTYPVSVGIVWMFKRRMPWITLLPFVNVAAFAIACKMN